MTPIRANVLPPTEGPARPWFLAACARCNPHFAEPFRDETERDLWAIAHAVGEGHTVRLMVEEDGMPDVALPHTTAVLTIHRDGWRFTCTDPACGRTNGPYPSGQLALVSLRAHTTRAAR